MLKTTMNNSSTIPFNRSKDKKDLPRFKEISKLANEI